MLEFALAFDGSGCLQGYTLWLSRSSNWQELALYEMCLQVWESLSVQSCNEVKQWMASIRITLLTMPMKVSVLVAFHEVHVLGHDEGMKNMAQLYLADEDAEDVDGGCLELRKLWNWTKPRMKVPAVETEECRYVRNVMPVANR